VFQIVSVKTARKGKRKNNPTGSRSSTPLWKGIYVVLCLSLIALTAFQFFWIHLDTLAGWDYYVYSGAVQSLDHLQNPYILDNINQYVGANTGGKLPFTYPPHTLYFFWLLNIFHVFQNIAIYYVLLIFLLVASGYLLATMDQKPDYLLCVTLLLTAFMATVWNFGTGNKDIFFLFLFVLVLLLLLKEKYWQSAILLGLTAAISLITAPFVALYLVVQRPLQSRLGYIILSGSVVAVLFLVSYIVSPTYFFSYIDTLKGGSTSPLYDLGGYNTPTPYLMFKDLLDGANIGGMLPVALISCVYIALILYACWNFWIKNQYNSLKIYSLVMVAVFMLLPRIKPYDFIILVIPLYFLFKDSSLPMKCLMFVVTSLPIFGWYLNFIVYPLDIPFLIGVYTQTYSLILIFIVIILQDHLKSTSLPAENKPEST